MWACVLTFVRFVHELEQLIDDGLQELPVGFQEARVLPNNVHDVACHHGLVVLAAFHLCEPQQILDDGDQEPFFRLFIHGQRDGADGPAEHVAVVPRPLRAVDLAG